MAEEQLPPPGGGQPPDVGGGGEEQLPPPTLQPQGWQGRLDEVAIYPTKLSDERRLAHHQARLGAREWVMQRTSNPASLYRAILQDVGNARPVSDARLDLAALQAWHVENDAAGRSCNLVVDYKTTIFDLQKVIAACGRATPAANDGKFATVRDIPQSVPVQHFTPRNSRNFSGRRALLDRPHAYKVRFTDAAANWQSSERIVYDDGYSEAGETPGTVAASKFEVMELHGVTDADHAWRLGRYYLAVGKLRPEAYTLETDVESLACRRGDLVRIAHDVTEWGLAQGRVKAVATNGSGQAIGVTVDELFTMIDGPSYSVRFRLADGSSLVARLATVPGDNQTVTFVTPIAPPLPAVGDLALFGLTNLESVEALVSRIVPGPELSAVLTLVDKAPGVLTADQLPIPPWDPQMTRPVLANQDPPTPLILAIESDETVLLRALDGSLQSRIVLSLDYQSTSRVRADYVEVRWRRTGSAQPYDALPNNPPDVRTVSITAVEDGVAYDVRVRSVNLQGSASPWAEVLGYVVIGKSSPPPAPTNLRLEADDALRWDYLTPPLDLLGFELRRSPGATGVWTTAVEMHVGTVTASPFFLPPNIYGPWTFMVAAIDTSGNASAPTSLTINFGPPVVGNLVESFAYKPTFPGSITNGSVVSTNLVADQITTGFWTVDGNLFWSVSGTTLFWQGTYKEMTYVFSFTPAAASAGARLVIDATVAAASWTLEWKKGAADFAPFPGMLEPITAEAHTFRLITSAATVQGVVSALTLYIDADDIVEDQRNVAIGSSGTRLTLGRTYRFIKTVLATVVADGGSAVVARVEDRQNLAGANNGPLIVTGQVSPFTLTAGHVDVHITGY